MGQFYQPQLPLSATPDQGYKCTRCGQRKPQSAFQPELGRRDGRGLRSWCRACEADRLKDWRQRNPDKRRAQTARHKANQRSAGRGDYSGDPALKIRARNKHLKAKYGITVDDEARMLKRQGGRCAACGVEARLVVDHCHATGKVRELLCDDCNVALGRVKDDPDRMRRLANYVERHRMGGSDE